MKFLIPVTVAILLILTGMHTLLQYMPWEHAMRVVGISMSILAAIGAALYLNPESN